MKTTKEILIAARALIATPDRWTKHTSARDANDAPVIISDNNAICFCAGGAIEKAAPGSFDKLAKFIMMANGLRWILTAWNDAPERTHAEVLAAFSRAIELA